MIVPISLESITPRHVFWLAKICQEDYTGMEAKDLILDAAKGVLQLWETPSDGVIVTEVLQHPAGKEFLVFGIAGEGLDILKIARWAREEGKRLGCRWVGGNTTNPKMERISKRLAKKISSRFLTEV